MKAKISIDTLSRINKFVAICSKIDCPIHLVDGNGYCISAKSILGAVATADWSEVFVECEQDIYSAIQEFIVD